MGNTSSTHHWRNNYQFLSRDPVNINKAMLQHKTQHYACQLLTVYITEQAQRIQLEKRLQMRDKIKSKYIVPFEAISHQGQDHMCGGNSKIDLLYKDSSHTLQTYFNYRKAKHFSFSNEEIMYLIRNVSLALKDIQQIQQRNGSVNLNNIVINEQILLKDPIVIEQQQKQRIEIRSSSKSNKKIKGFPSPLKLREQIDTGMRIDEQKQDLFSLGVVALQLYFMDFNFSEIYISRSKDYQNNQIDFNKLNNFIHNMRSGQLQDWVRVLTSRDSSPRMFIYQLIKKFDIPKNQIRILTERPRRLTPEQQLAEQLSQPIQKYYFSEQNQFKRPSLTVQQKHPVVHNSFPQNNTYFNPSQRPEYRTLPINGHQISSSFSNYPPQPPMKTSLLFSDFLNKNENPRHMIQPTPPHLNVSYNPINRSPSPKKIQLPQPLTFGKLPNQKLQNIEDVLKKDQEIPKTSEELPLSIKNDGKDLSTQNQRKQKPKETEQSLKSLQDELAELQQITRKNQQLYKMITSGKLSLFEQSSMPQSQQIIEQVDQENSHVEQPQFVVEQYEGGTKYEGYKIHGKRNGTGKFYYKEGSIYDGQWHNNSMNGYGVLYYPEGAIAYQGWWKNDQFHGKGTIHNNNPVEILGSFDSRDFNLLQQDQWQSYEGQLRNDERNGVGKLTLSNGQFYQGEFENNKTHGTGVFRKLNGKYIKGIWSQNILKTVLD